MATFSSKVVRQLNLLIYFLQVQGSVKFPQIKECINGYKKLKSDTARKLFERDKKDLRESGIPLLYDKSEETYIIEKKNLYIPEIELDEEEKIHLRILINLLIQNTEFPVFRNELMSSLQKLISSGYISTDENFSPPPYALTKQVSKSSVSLDKHLSIITNAIFDKQRIQIMYPSEDVEAGISRKIDPLGIIFREGIPYLIGYCHLRQAVRIFNLFRISEIQIISIEKEDMPFTIPNGFKIDKYTSREIWEFETEPPYQAEIRFSAEIGWMIENQLKGKAPLEKLKNGDVIFKPTVTNTEGIIDFVLSFGNKAVVEKPENLRRYIRNEICCILNEYNELF